MSKASQPLVSVVVPCLNRAHFLVPTIESILGQNYPNLECIVVDGGSTDSTIDILKSYGDRIQWVSEPDDGHADAINKGWQMSQGEILAWLNADDVYATPDAVRIGVEYLQAHSEAKVVYGRCGAIDPEGRQTGMSYWHEFDLLYAVRYCDHCIPQPASFIRRSILEQVGWLDTAFYQKKDHELWLRLGLVGQIHWIPDTLAHAREHPGNLGHQGDTTADACIQLTEKFFANPDLPPEFRRIQHEALSNAHLRGLIYAWEDGHHASKTLSFLARAIALYPPNIGRAMVTATSVIVSELLGIQRNKEFTVPGEGPETGSQTEARTWKG